MIVWKQIGVSPLQTNNSVYIPLEFAKNKAAKQS